MLLDTWFLPPIPDFPPIEPTEVHLWWMEIILMRLQQVKATLPTRA